MIVPVVFVLDHTQTWHPYRRRRRTGGGGAVVPGRDEKRIYTVFISYDYSGSTVFRPPGDKKQASHQALVCMKNGYHTAAD